MSALNTEAVKACRERDGAPAADRPAYVEGALEADETVGWREGSPLLGETVKLGEDPSEAYDHYLRRDDLLRPEAGEFLERLAEHPLIGDASDIADETKSDVSTVRTALELHDISVTDAEADAAETPADHIALPNGDTVSEAYLSEPPWSDARILQQLLARNGMSVSEAATYLKAETGENIAASDVREAAKGCGMLE